jgi:hypothetical protein
LPAGEERAFVANYQTLGLLRDGRIVILEPGRRIRIAPCAGAGEPRQAEPLPDHQLQREAIAWYEAASLTFHRHRYLDFDEDVVGKKRPPPNVSDGNAGIREAALAGEAPAH